MALADSPLDLRMVRRLLDLPAREKDELRAAVEAAERRRSLLYRAVPGARPTPHPIALTPLTLPGRLVPTLHRLARAVHRFQAGAPELYRAGVLDFRDLCPLGPIAEEWFRRHYRRSSAWDLLIRLDVGLTRERRPCLYETNSAAVAGLFNHTAGAEILRHEVFPRILPPRDRRRLQGPPDLLALAYSWVTQGARRLGIRRRPLGVAFVEPPDHGQWFSEIPRIARYFRSRGVLASCGGPQRLRLHGDEVRLGADPVDLVYRDVELENLPFPSPSGRRLAGLARMLEAGAALPGFSGEFDHKGILECLTSPAYEGFFGAVERRLLRACVPWTRVLWARRTDGPSAERIDLPRYVASRKDDLVIKPNRGSGGEAILLGSGTPAALWERRIGQALAEPGGWVVQRRADSMRKPMVYLKEGRIRAAPCHFSLGLFYFPDRLGLHARIGPLPLVNVARGGALACAFPTR